MKKIIWFLMDNRMGSVGQAKGIIQALDKERYEIVEKKIDYNRLANLPNFLLGKSLLGVTAATRKELRHPGPTWPYPSAGGRFRQPVSSKRHPEE